MTKVPNTKAPAQEAIVVVVKTIDPKEHEQGPGTTFQKMWWEPVVVIDFYAEPT